MFCYFSHFRPCNWVIKYVPRGAPARLRLTAYA
jgi:hypothetical protein